jgi:hypothetical protein
MSNVEALSTILLITGNTRVGGAQRILLDEFYEIQSRGISARIVSLSPSIPEDDILNVDSNFHLSKEVSVEYAGINRISQVLYLIKVLKKKNGISGIVSHDFPGVVICRLATFILGRRVHVSLYIHQLMDMSSRVQRQKRIFMSLFASQIYVSSFQFKKSWEEHLQSSNFWRFVFKKTIVFDRMGIHIPRVENFDHLKIKPCPRDVPHLVFMSRITAWKGFSDFKDFAKSYTSDGLHSLTLTTRNNRLEILDESDFVNDYNHLIYESGVSNIHFPRGSVHFYPTNYGHEIKFPQSIGMNVLEFLAVGVPSIISLESFESWPELESSVLVRTVDWRDKESLFSLWGELSSLNASTVQKEVERLIPTISISSHIDRIVKDLAL